MSSTSPEDKATPSSSNVLVPSSSSSGGIILPSQGIIFPTQGIILPTTPIAPQYTTGTVPVRFNYQGLSSKSAAPKSSVVIQSFEMPREQPSSSSMIFQTKPQKHNVPKKRVVKPKVKVTANPKSSASAPRTATFVEVPGGMPVVKVSSTSQLGATFVTYSPVENSSKVQFIPEFVQYSPVAMASDTQSVPNTTQKDSHPDVQLAGIPTPQLQLERNEAAFPVDTPSVTPKSSRRKQKWTELREPYPADQKDSVFGYHSLGKESVFKKPSIPEEPTKSRDTKATHRDPSPNNERPLPSGSSGPLPSGEDLHTAVHGSPGSPASPSQESLPISNSEKIEKSSPRGRGGRKGKGPQSSRNVPRNPIPPPRPLPKGKSTAAMQKAENLLRETREKLAMAQSRKISPEKKPNSPSPPELSEPASTSTPTPTPILDFPNPDAEKLRTIIAGRYDRRKHLLVEDKSVRTMCQYDGNYICTEKVATVNGVLCLGHTKLIQNDKKSSKTKKILDCAFVSESGGTKCKCTNPATPESRNAKYCVAHDLDLKRARQLLLSNCGRNDYITTFRNLCIAEIPKKLQFNAGRSNATPTKQSYTNEKQSEVNDQSPTKPKDDSQDIDLSGTKNSNKTGNERNDLDAPTSSKNAAAEQNTIKDPKITDKVSSEPTEQIGTNDPKGSEKTFPSKTGKKGAPTSTYPGLGASNNTFPLITHEKLLDPDNPLSYSDLLLEYEELEDYKDPSLRDMEVYQQFQADSDENSDEEEATPHRLISTAGYHTTDELSLMLQQKLEELNSLYKYHRELDKEAYRMRYKIFLEHMEEDSKLKKGKKKLCSNPDMLPLNKQGFSIPYIINQYVERETVRHLLKMGGTKGPMGLLIRKAIDAKKAKEENLLVPPSRYRHVAPSPNKRFEGKPMFSPGKKDSPDKSVAGKMSPTKKVHIVGDSKSVSENMSSDDEPTPGSSKQKSGRKSVPENEPDISADTGSIRISGKKSPSKKESAEKKSATNVSPDICSITRPSGTRVIKPTPERECFVEITKSGKKPFSKEERISVGSKGMSGKKSKTEFPGGSSKDVCSPEKKSSRNRTSSKNLSESEEPKPVWPKKCIKTDCRGNALPLAKYCYDHIIYDTKQVLFTACGNLKTTNTPCDTPLLSLDQKGCPIHAEDWLPDLPLSKEEREHIQEEELKQMLLPDAENEVVDNILVNNFFDMAHLEEELAAVLESDYLDTSSESDESADEEKILPPLKPVDTREVNEADPDFEILSRSENSDTEDEDFVDLIDE